MTYELTSGSDYRPVRRTDGSALSPVERIIALRKSAMLDRAQVAAETASEEFQIQQRMDTGYNLAMHAVSRSAQLAAFIHDTGDIPELHQLNGYLMLASTEAIVGLMKGRRS